MTALQLKRAEQRLELEGPEAERGRAAVDGRRRDLDGKMERVV